MAHFNINYDYCSLSLLAPVVGVTWNDKENKLTTCDQNGLIVVWVLYK